MIRFVILDTSVLLGPINPADFDPRDRIGVPEEVLIDLSNARVTGWPSDSAAPRPLNPGETPKRVSIGASSGRSWETRRAKGYYVSELADLVLEGKVGNDRTGLPELACAVLAASFPAVLITRDPEMYRGLGNTVEHPLALSNLFVEKLGERSPFQGKDPQPPG